MPHQLCKDGLCISQLDCRSRQDALLQHPLAGLCGRAGSIRYLPHAARAAVHTSHHAGAVEQQQDREGHHLHIRHGPGNLLDLPGV